MKKDLLPSKAKVILKHILIDHGEVIYSSHETLKKGDIYLLGLNPGGDGFISIEEHIDAMLTNTKNAYVDAPWPNGQKKWSVGENPLQKRVNWLLSNLGYEIRDVCASNLIFKTTQNSGDLCFGLAGLCWPFHELVLDIVQPKIILTFGNSKESAYSFLRALYKGSEIAPQPSGHGNWLCKAFKTQINNKDVLVVGLPHMSYYNPIGKVDLIEWLLRNANIIG